MHTRFLPMAGCFNSNPLSLSHRMCTYYFSLTGHISNSKLMLCGILIKSETKKKFYAKQRWIFHHYSSSLCSEFLSFLNSFTLILFGAMGKMMQELENFNLLSLERKFFGKCMTNEWEGRCQKQKRGFWLANE